MGAQEREADSLSHLGWVEVGPAARRKVMHLCPSWLQQTKSLSFKWPRDEFYNAAFRALLDIIILKVAQDQTWRVGQVG